jgi:hypothetical protein
LKPKYVLLILDLKFEQICVNGETFLRIPNPNRYKALLFGLNMTDPLHLNLKCMGTGAFRVQESTITYIA